MGRGAIDLDASRPSCAFHDVGLKARSIGYVVNLDLLVGQQAGSVHELTIDGYATLVV
jgi:hypothetical protein